MSVCVLNTHPKYQHCYDLLLETVLAQLLCWLKKSMFLFINEKKPAFDLYNLQPIIHINRYREWRRFLSCVCIYIYIYICVCFNHKGYQYLYSTYNKWLFSNDIYNTTININSLDHLSYQCISLGSISMISYYLHVEKYGIAIRRYNGS